MESIIAVIKLENFGKEHYQVDTLCRIKFTELSFKSYENDNKHARTAQNQ